MSCSVMRLAVRRLVHAPLSAYQSLRCVICASVTLYPSPHVSIYGDNGGSEDQPSWE
jgi:hypothetical protein